jgi:S1-C subfamily serine protease
MREKSRFFLASAIIGLILPQALSSQILSPADIMERYGKAVVLIATIKDNKEIGLGSGFIVKNNGVIITNYHVIDGAYPALVKTRAGDIYDDISVINIDARKDISIIKINGFDLPVVNLGNSNNIRIGEKVVVIGNPHGFENTISDGLLSQQRDTGEGYVLHQISAPVSGGSSGSPVFNQKGEVIGIATLSDTKGQNLNFSVPINYARGMIDGPVKYSLKEFSALGKEPTFTSKGNEQDFADRAEVLKKMLVIISNLYSAMENAQEGLENTRAPHLKEFDYSKYYIDLKIQFANQLLKRDSLVLNELNLNDNTLLRFRDTLLSAASLSLESSFELIRALERTSTNSYGNIFPFPDWQKANAALLGIAAGLSKIDEEFRIKLVGLVKKDFQKLESYLLPSFLTSYENRDMTPDELREANNKMGYMSINFRLSTREPVVWFVRPGGAAEKAGMKRDDVILGLAGGPNFNTQMDLFAFQKGTKPGETYEFRIRRGSQEMVFTITLTKAVI